jgi:hypothetical protein
MGRKQWYLGKPNRDFLALNKIADGTMRKNATGTELAEYKMAHNKAISKIRATLEIRWISL